MIFSSNRTANGDNITEVINEVIFINDKGEEMPLPLKDPKNRCYECPMKKGESYEYIQYFTIPDDYPNVNNFVISFLIIRTLIKSNEILF